MHNWQWPPLEHLNQGKPQTEAYRTGWAARQHVMVHGRRVQYSMVQYRRLYRARCGLFEQCLGDGEMLYEVLEL